ncbi:MAG: hypothetical protein QOG63_3211 [Thermoleophilaceae bacterium]|nr:hypothetical protein [Thermoleophilaceae bacterium]
MIRQIETTDPAQANRQASAVAPATPAGRNFASVLASQKHADGVHAKEPIDAPDGEVWRPVRGDDNYAKIIEGPRAGLYINLSRGARRGETFSVENRDGVRVHVYQGKNGKETVVPAAKDTGKVHAGDPEAASASRRPHSEQWAPVDGANNYADILSGPRNGWFVNTSGGVRDGMAFHIVHKGDKTFHVYGTGKHRQLVEVDPADAKAQPGKGHATGAVAASESDTGGAAAPSSDD